MRWTGRLSSKSLLHPRFAASVQRVSGWMSWPLIHLFNNVDQWETVFEIRPGEPSPESIATKRPDSDFDEDPDEPGLEPPSSFWPKFEHRFRPAEETWSSDALPAARRAGGGGAEAIKLFDRVLEARDELVEVLPPDGQTPRTRVGGQAVLGRMRVLVNAMEAFQVFADRTGGVLSKGLQDEVGRWWDAGPHEGLNW